jgi:transposase-like protein
MSKIPQGEWNAIAARYAQGESISRIAQSYGCTPPAIHYILKRNKQRASHNPGLPLNGTPQPRPQITPRPMTPHETAPVPLQPQAVGSPAHGGARENSRSIGEEGRLGPVGPVAIQPGRDPRVPPFTPGQTEQGAAHFLRQRPSSSRERGNTAVALDSELHGRAEAAIAAFRSSFDAALAEASPHVRQRLREAAADLMRVAARTTIVLDQLNARADR